jgi:hypothetical protein
MAKAKVISKVTPIEHLYNAVARAKQEPMTVIKAGQAECENYIVVNGELAYNVTVKGGKVVGCDCPHHQFRKVPCKHMAKVSLIREMEMTVTFKVV